MATRRASASSTSARSATCRSSRASTLRFVPLEHADYVVCTGLFDDETRDAGRLSRSLSQLRERNLFMLCANPDLVVERGDQLVYCAGAIADLYAALGGEVFYAGKPHRPIYDLALARIAALRGRDAGTARVLAIGDSVRTDLKGAAGFRHRLPVRDRRHPCRGAGRPRRSRRRRATEMFADAGVAPKAVTRRLVW